MKRVGDGQSHLNVTNSPEDCDQWHFDILNSFCRTMIMLNIFVGIESYITAELFNFFFNNAEGVTL